MKDRFRIFLFLALLYAVLIFYLSSQSNPGDPRSFLEHLYSRELLDVLMSIERSDLRFILYPLYLYSVYPDKVIHAILYSGFGFLLYLTLKNSPSRTLSSYAFLFAIIIGTVYGATDEFHQSFVPRRTMSIDDLLADCIGLTIAQMIIFITKTIIFIKDKLYFKR